MESAWTSDVYLVDPSTVKFDDDISSFNPVHNKVEYEATKKSIEAIGQQEPIQINDKTELCEGGRHRVRICIELGIQVKARKIDGSLDVQTRMQYANREEMSGRDFNNAQKAVMALRFATKTNTKMNTAAKMYKVSHKLVSYAAKLNGIGRHGILDDIVANGKALTPNNKTTSNLERLAREWSAEFEQATVDNSMEPSIDYNVMINTEKGKVWFWNIRGADEIRKEISLALVELANYKYKESKLP